MAVNSWTDFDELVGLADRMAQVVERLLGILGPRHRHKHARSVRRPEGVADNLARRGLAGGVMAARVHDAAMRHRPAALTGPGVDPETVPAVVTARRPPRLRPVDPGFDVVAEKRVRRIEDIEKRQIVRSGNEPAAGAGKHLPVRMQL